MPVKMSSDIPLPMPRSVVVHPASMMKAVPQVRVRTHVRMNDHLLMVTMGEPVEVPVRVKRR